MNNQNSEPPYDVLVIGGGIAGAGISRHCALAGLSVGVMEKKSFGGGASSASSKLIHGGIRYLETAWDHLRSGNFSGFWTNFRFVIRSLIECSRLEKMASDLITPLPILIPIYENSKRSKLSIFLGCFLYWILGLFSGRSHLPRFFWSGKSVLKYLPVLNAERLKGGVVIYERITDDLSLVQRTLLSAQKHGCRLFENTNVLSWEYDHRFRHYKVTTVNAVGKTSVLHSKKLINATGAWIDKVRDRVHPGSQNLIEGVSGSHIHIPCFTDKSMLLEAEDGRLFFCIFRGNHLRVGTTEIACPDPDRANASEDEITYLMNSLKKYFPGVNVTRNEIMHADSGVRPLASPKSDTLMSRISRDHEIIEDNDGLLNMVGVKLTDHRRAAEDCFKKMKPDLQKHNIKFKNIRTYKLHI